MSEKGWMIFLTAIVVLTISGLVALVCIPTEKDTLENRPGSMRYEIGDYVVGEFPDGIQYWNYDPKTKTITFRDDKTGNFLRTANDSDIVVYVPEISFQDSFAIYDPIFILEDEANDLYIMDAEINN
jgi:hypothetical protein